jgi:uncharacterized membrane protein
MTTPLDLVPPSAVRPIFITLIAGTLILMGVMRFVYGTQPRVTALQTARTAKNATDIICTWTKSGVLHKARMNMYWDYLFIPFYSTLAAMTCFAIARNRVGGWSEAAIVLGWCSWLAAACDLSEDLALEFVWRQPGPFATGIATACSYTKSGLLIAVILFAIASSFFR